MKASQKFNLDIENIKVVVRFDEMPKNLMQLVALLEIEGDFYGPVVNLLTTNGNPMCVSISYHDKPRRGGKLTINLKDYE